MKVLVSGSSGLIGSALIAELQSHGHEVVRLVRGARPGSLPQVVWHPAKGELNPDDLAGIDAVIHLAGENIANGRWNEEKKERILQSRMQTTRLLAETLAGMENPPHTFISASAIGFYGDRPDENLTEVSHPGKGFLPRVCQLWEEATLPARNKGIRTVIARTGIVLSPQGGALKAMLPAFRLGLAGNLSMAGRQHMSWISLRDEVRAIVHLLETPGIQGPVNLTAPAPVTNAEFTSTMRELLIPAFLPMHYWTPPAPAPAVSLLLGEMGDELLLADTKVLPVRLEETGFRFKHPTLRQALVSMV
ncbi:MAG: TIGR01777 family oxidoreductase [Candidatus Melainabacteria bacterium]